MTLAQLSTDQKTAALIEALPYICEYVGKTIVVNLSVRGDMDLETVGAALGVQR